jgi:hypothetical protein
MEDGRRIVMRAEMERWALVDEWMDEWMDDGIVVQGCLGE